jgi:hypothetical protein
VTLYKTDYEEGRLQPTPAGHPKGELLSTGFSMVSGLMLRQSDFSINDYKWFEFPEKRMSVSMTTNVLKVGAEPVVQVFGKG